MEGLSRGELELTLGPNVLSGLVTERSGCARSLLCSAVLPPGRLWGKKSLIYFCYQGISCSAPVRAGNKRVVASLFG